MNFLPAFGTWQFAAAGALCALAPIIIHLLNRRRYRVVNWAAMRFLQEAMQRNRKIMHLRDLLLLILRTAAVAFFGLALARPYLAARNENLDTGQPVHAVLLIDNSLSMGYQTLAGSLLDEAKKRATAFVERLPTGSRISVIPLCGSAEGRLLEPFDTKPFAIEAIQTLEVVDRSMTISQALNEARRAAEAVPELATRHILFSDQQRMNWRDASVLNSQPELPAIQIVQVSAEERENTWVASLDVPDGVADSETPTVIRAEIRHQGREPRGDVRVTLSVNGEEVDSQIASLNSADANREVTFEYTFREFEPEPARPAFVPIQVSIAPDRLPEDDQRHLLVPVVAVLPVVFVDQYGEDEENPALNRLGETRHLRQLLAPAINRAKDSRSLVEIRHRRMEQLDRDLLADARLVAIAGVPSPEDKVQLLREFVEQGGQLVVAAGAEFDPVAWNAAWNDGTGILPLPLLPETIGTLPEVAPDNLKPFSLSFESLGQHPYFQLAGNSEDDLRDLYAEPFFFKAVQVNEGTNVLASLRQTIAEEEVSRAAAGDAKKENATSTELQTQESSGARWLLWAPPGTPTDTTVTRRDDVANSQQDQDLRIAQRMPKILARFSSETGPAFLVERAIGSGRVIFATSGLLSSWNTLPKTNSIIIFDRILRGMIQATLPQRNYDAVPRIAIPIPDEARDASIVLTRPGYTPREESLDTGFLGVDHVGVTIERPLTRGIYQLQARTSQAVPAGSPEERPSWSFAVSVNGDSQESDLQPMDRQSFEEVVTNENLRWVGVEDEVSLAGAHIRGQDFWWWIALTVLLLLFVELAILAWPNLGWRGTGR